MATPLVLSPASPAELLHHIVSHQTYPTTLLICLPRTDFHEALEHDVRDRSEAVEGPQQASDKALSLLSAPLYQRAVARHIRVLFIPTVTHLRAYLAVFSPEDSKAPAPPGFEPAMEAPAVNRQAPLLLVYGFLELHRDSSEWSAQGISNTAAALVESAQRNRFRAAIVEPRGSGGHASFEALLGDAAPVLSGSIRREEGGWTGRTVEMRRILGRWFRFQTGQWDVK